MKKVIVVVMLLGMSFWLTASAMAADFYLVGANCKMTVGYLSNVKTSEQLKTGIFSPYVGKCTRLSKKVQCDFINLETREATPTIELKVLLDSPPYLNLSYSDGGEFIAINLTTRNYVSITRIVDTEFLASKTCYGKYITEGELKALNNK